MAEEIRVAVYDRKNEAPNALAARLHKLLAELSPLHPSMQKWSFTRDDKTRPIARAEDVEEAVRASAKEWEAAGKTRTAYGPQFFVDDPLGEPARLNVVAGIAPIGDVPAWTPNRYEIVLRRAALFEPTLVAAILRRAVRNLDPEWGLVRVDGAPSAPIPVFSDGAPVIGWMTYLSRRFPPIPAVPPPSAAYPLPELGTLLVAMPNAFDPKSSDHRAIVERLRLALTDAKVLLPAQAIPR